MRTTSRARMSALAVVGVLALVAAACGDDSGSGSTTAASVATTSVPAPTTAAPATTVSPGTTVAADTTVVPETTAAPDTTVVPETTAAPELLGIALAKARIDEFRKTPDVVGITETLTSIPQGAKIVYVQCSVPVCAAIGEGIKAAADAAGAEFVAIPHSDTADTVQAAFQQAIQAEPTMVMTSGNPREWFADELATLNEKKIPVVAWSIPEPYKTDGFAANLITGDDYWFNGVLMADYVTAETEGKGNVLFLNIPQFPVLGIEGQGFEEEYAKVCEGCKLKKVDITVPDLIAGKHIATAIAELQADPSINFIVTGFGDMVLGMPDALSGAGIGQDVRIISQAGSSANYALITGGMLQVADIGLPTGFLGWRAVDAGFRALAGQDTGVFLPRPLTSFADHPDVQIAGMPFQILEASSIADPTVAWPGVVGYEDAFKALWGVA